MAARGRFAIEAMRRARFIVTPTRAMASAIRFYQPELSKKEFRVLYHGFSAAALQQPLSSAIRQRMERGSLKLLYLTHPAPHKGFHIAFQAVRELKQRGHDPVLYATICKEEWSSLVSEYERQAASCDVLDRVVFLGSVPPDQVGELYRMASVFVWPSLLESFGFPLVEAMACRAPIVAAGTEVNRELCENAAIYYSPRDAADFADCVERVLCTSERERLRLECDRRMNSFDWSWDRYTREFGEIINEA